MNKDKRNNIQLLGTLTNADESGIIANASQIYDANENKSTQDVSKEHTERIKTLEDKENELIAAVGTGGSVDTRITNAVNVEKTRAEGAESTLDGKITAEQTRAANAENALDGRVDTLEEAVGTGGSVDSKIASAVATETSRAQEAEANRYTKNETYTKEEVNNLITTPNQEYVSVTATDQTTAVTDVLPAIGLANTVYRVGSWDGSQYDVTKYSEYAWNGKDYVHLSTKTGETSAASDVTYNHNDSKLDATNVQQAVDEVYKKSTEQGKILAEKIILLGKPNDISVPTTVNVTNKDGSVPNKGFYTRDAAVGSVFAENTTSYAGIYSVKLALTKGQKITFRKETSKNGVFSNAVICNEKREVLVNQFFSSGSSYTPTENGFLYCNFNNRESEAEVVFIEYETTISFLSNKQLENEISAVDKKLDYVIKTDVLQIVWHTDKLISYNTVINNKAWDGSFATAGGFSASDYIDVHDYTKIQLKLTLGPNVNNFIIIADRNKSLLKVIGRTDLSESYEIELPYGAYFMAISCQTGENKVSGVALSFVKRSEIVDDLNTDNEYYPLSANQGKVIGVAQSYTDSLLPQKKEILHDGYWRAVLFSINGKYFSVANVKKVIDQMHEVNLNKLMIDFSNDQGFRLSINTDDTQPSEMLIRANGKTYDLTTALGDHAGVSNIGDPDGSNKWLTRADMTEIINYASDRDIEIIPSFGFPNHMGAIIDTFSEFKFVTNRCCNFTTNEGRNFMLAILERYVDFFASLGNSFHFNIRGDELGGILNDARTRETFNAFINQCFRVIVHHKMIPLVYNDNIKPDLANDAYISDGFEVLHWWSWNRPEDLISKGYRLVNLNADTQYWVLGNTNNPTADTIKSKVDPRMYRSGLYSDGGLGSMLCFFTDKAYTDGADEGNKMTNDVLPIIKAFGEKMAEENNNVNIFSRTLDIVNPSENFVAKANSIYYVDINIDERKNVTGKDGQQHLKKTGIRIEKLIGGTVNRNDNLQIMYLTNVSAYLDKDGYLQEGVVRLWFTNTSGNDIDVTPQNVTIKYYGTPSYYIVRI